MRPREEVAHGKLSNRRLGKRKEKGNKDKERKNPTRMEGKAGEKKMWLSDGGQKWMKAKCAFLFKAFTFACDSSGFLINKLKWMRPVLTVSASDCISAAPLFTYVMPQSSDPARQSRSHHPARPSVLSCNCHLSQTIQQKSSLTLTRHICHRHFL